MILNLEVQDAAGAHQTPNYQQIAAWVRAAVRDHQAEATLTVRLVDEEEGADMNRRWRRRSGATNVLSFPCQGLEQIRPDLLGDIVVCAPVVNREAAAQHKPQTAHWAHIIVHGTLHLCGMDHQSPNDAEQMERLEISILKQLGYPNPYEMTV